MSDLSVPYAALSHASGTVNAVHDELTTAASTLDDRAAAFLAVGWRGSAADGYHAGYQDWRAGLREVLAAIAEMAVLIDQSSRRFAMSDERVDLEIALLQHRLGRS